ncbi:MAG: recombination protein RecR, partial [Verrucomicrobia bacterium]|nr:recombination protein RecR [Verrucomicrobiota bacterium]
MQRIDYPPLMQELIRQLRRMPGIGPRSAERIALWIVQRKEARANEIAETISKAVLRIRSCVRCGFFSETEQCAICADPGRDSTSLCVVEQPTDILSLERTGAFRGFYHSLGGRLSPLDHIGPEDLRIDGLLRRVQEERPREVIFALSADVEGEATLSYLADL